MRDDFKKWARDRSEEFEHPFDTTEGWEKFQKRKPKPRVRNYWVAAASLVLLTAITAIWKIQQPDESPELTEWEEVAIFYQEQVNEMTALVINLTDDQDLLEDLDQMDQAFAELKADLQDDAANEEVIEAMMEEYRLKLRILEKMLDEIRAENEKENIPGV